MAVPGVAMAFVPVLVVEDPVGISDSTQGEGLVEYSTLAANYPQETLKGVFIDVLFALSLELLLPEAETLGTIAISRKHDRGELDCEVKKAE